MDIIFHKTAKTDAEVDNFETVTKVLILQVLLLDSFVKYFWKILSCEEWDLANNWAMTSNVRYRA